jgi:multiple antibiotic resistance protein
MTRFVATFAPLLSIINPLEALPVFLQLARHKDDQERERIARRACLNAVALMFFFLILALCSPASSEHRSAWFVLSAASY